MRALNIIWDADEDIREELPADMDIPDGMTDTEEISDYITAQTGFCHFGFEIGA